MSQRLRRLASWVQSVQSAQHLIFAKYLSANDTNATTSHQVGVYVPKSAMFRLFPGLNQPSASNPRVEFTAEIASHPQVQPVMAAATWYNKETRDETRFTRWGGKSSPVQNPENTGALAIFAFPIKAGAYVESCSVWVATSAAETDYLLDAFGTVDPGRPLLVGMALVEKESTAQAVKLADMPATWRTNFPSGAELVKWVVGRTQNLRKLTPDQRLVKRRDLEYDCFKLLEAEVVLPVIQSGFTDVDSFIQFSNSVSNRRKSRSGTSLELHLAEIFGEEGVPFAAQTTSEGNKTPDFLFPSGTAYSDKSFPLERLRMLGVKTTCKDRWRQILNEADRLRGREIHLFTLQEGVSITQFKEMRAENVQLVVPKSLHIKYPTAMRGELQDLAGFIKEMKSL